MWVRQHSTSGAKGLHFVESGKMCAAWNYSWLDLSEMLQEK